MLADPFVNLRVRDVGSGHRRAHGKRELLHAAEHQDRAEHVKAHEYRGNRLEVLDVAEDALRDHRRQRE